MPNPIGQYTDVKVTPIQGGPGSLTGGTGTFSDTYVFSAGKFDSNDHPKIGEFYNITGKFGGSFYEFLGWKCTHSGQTSDFKEK